MRHHETGIIADANINSFSVGGWKHPSKNTSIPGEIEETPKQGETPKQTPQAKTLLLTTDR